MKAEKVNTVDSQSRYRKERLVQSFRTGAVIGTALSAANTIFDHRMIGDTFRQSVQKVGKSKALLKIGGAVTLNTALAVAFYGLLNVAICAVLDMFENRHNKTKMNVD